MKRPTDRYEKKNDTQKHIYAHLKIDKYIDMNIYIYIYIYIEREREREKDEKMIHKTYMRT